MEETKKRGRPRLTPEEKAENARKRKGGELPTIKRPNNLVNVHEVNTNPGDNSLYIRHALATLNLPPIDISDPAQVENRIQWYLNHCIENDMKPTVMGFCNSLGISRQTIYQWKMGNQRRETHQEVAVRAYRLLEELWEDYMLNGKVNPVSGIFLGKNNFGYQDKQEYVVTPNTGVVEERDLETIEAKYAELPSD